MASELPFTKQEARAELRRRILPELRARDPQLYREQVRKLLLRGLHEKQREVVEAVEAGDRYVSLCCSRRAGKTYLLCTLIVLKLLEAGHNQAVVLAAPTVGDGKDLIWPELSRMIEGLHLPWELRAFSVRTPEGALFKIQGLNKREHAEKPRGLDIVLYLVDESQRYEYLLAPLITAVWPALSGRKGCFVAAGTPGPSPQGFWHDIAHGLEGFRPFGWTIKDNTKNPRPGDEVLAEVRKEKGWSEQHPEYRREYLGEWCLDTNILVCDLQTTTEIRALPEDYGKHFRHVIGIDYGYVDDSAWVVLALDPYSPARYVVHAEKHANLDGDAWCDVTANLVKKYGTTYCVCDPAGGGKPFYAKFNAKYGQILGCQIRSADKVDRDGSISFLNTELRTERLKVLSPGADDLTKEMMKLRWKDTTRAAILEGTDFPDHCFVAGTLITTDQGDVPIEHVQPGDMVLTRKGYRRVTDAWCSGFAAVMRLRTVTGVELTGTSSHRMWTQDGWKALGALTTEDTLSCLLWSTSNTTDAPIAGTRTRGNEVTACTSSDALKVESNTSTGRSGRTLLARFLRAITSTTETTTPRTTLRRTWSVFLALCTCVTTGMTRGASMLLAHVGLSMPYQPQPNGTARPLVLSGTRSMARKLGRATCPLSARASSAANPTFPVHTVSLDGARMLAEQPRDASPAWMTSTSPVPTVEARSAATDMQNPSLVPARVHSVTVERESVAVFDLTVDGEHEFFANGLLVHNCFDALRYALNESVAWKPRTRPVLDATARAEAEWRERLRHDPEAREIEKRNRAARAEQRGISWGRGR